MDEWFKIITQRSIEGWMSITGIEAEFTEIIDDCVVNLSNQSYVSAFDVFSDFFDYNLLGYIVERTKMNFTHTVNN